MSASFGSIPEIIGRPDFLIWHAYCHRIGGRTWCEFDVTPAEFSGLNDGDRDLISTFSSALNLPVNGIQQWTIDRFISPYYAYNLSSQDWQDRIGVAWRVKIDYANVDVPFTYAGAGPTAVFGADPTWEEDDLFGEETEITSECTVIVDLPSRELVGSDLDVDKPRNKTEILEYKWENGEFCQVRTSIGPISFPQDESRIQKLLRQWQLRFGSIHWRENQYS